MSWIDVARLFAKTLFAAADVFQSRPPGPRILIYHQIGAGLGRQMEVTEEVFTRQIDWLQDIGEIVDLETALARRGESNSDQLFVLTFDDGYRDVYTNGFPVLKERGLPFTLYLATESIESGVPLTPGGHAEPLTWDQIGEMYDTGLATIGAHTHRHVDLRHAADRSIAEELDTSDDLILDRLGVQPTTFAYPWGYWSPAADSHVRERYSSAVLGSGRPITAGRDRFLLNRVAIQLADGMFFFARKLRGGMRLEDRVRRIVRRYEGP